MKQHPNESVLPIAAPALSRAEVLSVESDDEVLVRLHHARTEEVLRVELAVVGYRPAAGDRVLVSSDGYVLGVLGEARRRGPLVDHGDSVTLSAAHKLVIRAPAVEIVAEHAVVEVETLIEHARHTHRHAEEAHASLGRSRTAVAGACEVFGGRVSIISEGDTVVDGARVLLG